jgi:hypothetical protein
MEHFRQTYTLRITSGHQRRAGRGAHGRANVKIRESHTLCGHVVEMRRFKSLRPEAADVGIAQVIGENDNEVWLLGSWRAREKV